MDQYSDSPDPRRRPRFWLSDWRLIAAGSFALLGVGAGVWTMVRPAHTEHVEIDRAARSQRIFEHLGIADQPVTPVPDDGFIAMRSPAAFSDVLPRLRELFEERAAGVEILRDMPSDVRAGFAEAAVLAISPYLLVDFEMHLAHIDLLGGVPPRADPEDLRSVRFRWEHAHSRMGFTAIAPEFADVVVRGTRSEPPSKFAHIEIGRRFGMQEPGGSTTRTPHRYPGVAGWDKPDKALDAFFAHVPVKIHMKKAGDTRLGVIGVSLARNPETGGWQPVELRLFHDDANNPSFQTLEEVEAYLDFMPANLWM